MKWTEQQESAINTRGSDILVSAAAGSGKTAVLTERIKQLVINEGISVENMLIVTFSNAAAAEMKEKIIRALKQAADEQPEKAARLRSQIRRARTADISTFHKFSMGVIRRYFYMTDIDQNFGICDESRRTVMIEEALEELFEARFEGDEKESRENCSSLTFEQFLKMYADVRSEEKVKEMIRETYRFIMSMPDPFEWLRQAVEALNYDEEEFRNSAVYKALRGSVVKLMCRAVEIYEDVCDAVAGLPSIAPKAEEDMQQLLAAADAAENGTDEELSAALYIGFKTFRASKDDKADYDEIKEYISSKRDVAKDIIKSIKKEYFSMPLKDSAARVRGTYQAALYLEDLVCDFHERFTQKKRDKNILDFNDIEHYALNILRSGEIAREYKEHFDVIFIDEYQDSSILQETLIQQISRGDNVYMVGDVKQSIYKFRLAEPEIFIDKYNDFRDGARPGIRIDLNRNFRSKGCIINSVNAVFRNIMNRETCGIDYDEDAELKKGGDYEGELDRKTSLHIINTDVPEEIEGEEIDEAIFGMQKTELEAHVAAELAAERIGQEIYDQKKDCIRKIEPDDIVILLRGVRGQSEIYAKALKEVGIPAYIEAGEGYFETTEIEVFMNLLKVVDNRRSDLPLLSVLYSPIFGFTIDDLINIRLYNKKISYNEAFTSLAEAVQEIDGNDSSSVGDGNDPDGEPHRLPDELKPLAERCLKACEKLDRWRRYARFMPLETFLWRLMQETNYLDYVTALPGGDRRAANLRSLVDRAVDFSASQAKGLFAFLRYVEAMNDGSVQIGQSLQADSGERMTRIMTIHKSKGLEFPVVILAGLGKRFNRDRSTSRVIMHKDLGIAMQYSDPDRHCMSETISQRVIAEQKENERIAEEMRILYVAMTRPMDELVMVGSLKDLDKQMEKYYTGVRGGVYDASCYLDWIVPYCAEGGVDVVLHDRSAMSAAAAGEEEDASALMEEMRAGFPSFRDENGLASKLYERFSYEYPFAGDVNSKSKFAVSELNRVLRGIKTEDFRRSVKIAAADGESSDGAYSDVYGDIYQYKMNLSENEDRTEMSDYAVPKFMKGETAISAAARGTLVHKVLELISFEKPLDQNEIKEFVLGLPEAGYMTESEAEAVDCRKIAAFFSSETGRRACSAQWLRKEWPFTLRKKKEEILAMAASDEIRENMQDLADEVLIQGIIDCCFRDEQGIVIVDYKTDWVDRKNKAAAVARIREEYRRQLELYAEVVERALGERVSMKLLFLLDSGDAVEI